MGRTRTLRHDGKKRKKGKPFVMCRGLQFPLLQHALNVPAQRAPSPVCAPSPKQPVHTKLSGKS